MIVVGSLPRVREKPKLVEEEQIESRITPACAGKTLGIRCTSYPSLDHSRVCGKNVIWIIQCEYVMGSLPRVREKLWNAIMSVINTGITPACAGKTKSLVNFIEHG